MQNTSCKILALVGNFSPFLYDVADALCASDLNFRRLDIERIFVSVVEQVSRDYFFEEISKAEDLAQRHFLHYLDLLYTLQKLPDQKIQELYIPFYQKVQAMNKIILYRFYERVFHEVLFIQKSEQNCVFVHNYFYTPYPKRSEVFLDFFSLFQDNFKTLNIYTGIQASMELLQTTNQKFMNFVSSKPSSYEAYKAFQKHSCDRQQLKNFHDPLLLLSLFPAMYTLSAIPREDTLESIHGATLKKIYDAALIETKKLFGYTVQENYPCFYPKLERFNNIKESRVFLENEQMTYISTGNRIQSDYTLIFMKSLETYSSLLPQKFLENLNSWITHNTYIPYYETYISENSPTIISLSPLNRSPLLSTLHPQRQPNEILNIYEDNNVEIVFNHLMQDFSIPYSRKFSLLTQEGFWLRYHLSILKEGTVHLQYSHETRQSVNRCTEHLILINSLYIQLYKQLNRHFSITCTDLNTERSSNDSPVLINYGTLP